MCHYGEVERMNGHRFGVLACVGLLLVVGAVGPPSGGAAPSADRPHQQSGDGATEVRNLTIEQLSLIDVTLTNASIRSLTIVEGRHGNESLTNRTVENVSARTVVVQNAVMLNVTFVNATIRDDSVAEMLLGGAATNESVENGTIGNLTLDGVVVVEDETVDGVAIESAVVTNATVPTLTGDPRPVRQGANRTPALEVANVTVDRFRRSQVGNVTTTG